MQELREGHIGLVGAAGDIRRSGGERHLGGKQGHKGCDWF